MRFVSADYAQVELAVLAFLSQDRALLDAFRAGRDIQEMRPGDGAARIVPAAARSGATMGPCPEACR